MDRSWGRGFREEEFAILDTSLRRRVGEGGETDILNGRAFRLKVLGYLDGMPFTGVESPSSVQKQPFNGERFRRIDFGA